MSTPRSLELPPRVRPYTIHTDRGNFAALEASPDRGVCERQPALLIPGYTGSKEDFLPVLQPLAAAGRRVVAIDLRGQYESEGSADPGAYQPDALAADVLAAARQVAGEEQLVHLLGHSLGGLIARQAILADAGPLLSLTMLGSGPGRIGGERAAVLRETLTALRADGDPAALDPGELAGRIRLLWDTYLGPQAAGSGVAPPIVAFLRERTLRNSPIGLVVMARCLLDWPDRTAELAALAGKPVLVVFGEADDAWPPAVQQAMAGRLRAERVCIPGAAHSPAVEAPVTTASSLSTFWNEAERAERSRRREQADRCLPGPPAGRAPSDVPLEERAP